MQDQFLVSGFFSAEFCSGVAGVAGVAAGAGAAASAGLASLAAGAAGAAAGAGAAVGAAGVLVVVELGFSLHAVRASASEAAIRSVLVIVRFLRMQVLGGVARDTPRTAPARSERLNILPPAAFSTARAAPH
jgi:hypothetical protein